MTAKAGNSVGLVGGKIPLRLLPPFLMLDSELNISEFKMCMAAVNIAPILF
jgi:hypothetical protein